MSKFFSIESVLHVCNTAQIQTSFIMQSFFSYQSFSFIYFLTPQRGVNQKPFVPCQQSTLPFIWGILLGQKYKPHQVIIGHSLYTIFFEWMIRVMLWAISNLSWTNCGLWLPRGLVKNTKQMVLCPPLANHPPILSMDHICIFIFQSAWTFLGHFICS